MKFFSPILLISSFLTFVFGYVDTELLETSVVLSQNSYCYNEEIITYDRFISNIQLEFTYETKGSRVIGGYIEEYDSIFISYRGSENIHNWLNNVEFSLINPYDFNQSIKVEKGFYTEYDYTNEYVMEKIESLSNLYDTKSILITGHSAGAAMATLLTFDFILDNPNRFTLSLITFGSPRLGNINFVDYFNEFSYKFLLFYYRVTHYYDIVPHLPQQFLGYLHIPNEIWYDEYNRYITLCSDFNNKEDKSCSNSCGPIHCTSIDDHLYYINLTMGTSNC
jgi:hypothetical protein